MYRIDLYTGKEPPQILDPYEITTIFDNSLPFEEYQLGDPTLTLEDGTAGSLEFTMYPTNIGYDKIDKYKSFVRVFQNDEMIWEGRFSSSNVDFYKNINYIFEGEMSYLNDSIQPPYESDPDNDSIDDFMNHLLEVHNNVVRGNNGAYQQLVENKPNYIKFKNGGLFNPGLLKKKTWSTNFNTTLEAIKGIADDIGCHIILERGFDDHNQECIWIYFSENFDEQYFPESEQTIDFGVNLLDFSTNTNISDLYSAIIPYCDRGGNDGITTIENCDSVTQDDCQHDHGRYDIRKEYMVNAIGYRCKSVKVNSEDVTDEDKVLAAGIKYLNELQFEDIELEISAFDLSFIDPTFIDKPLKFQRKVRIKSELIHGVDLTLPLLKMIIKLASPQDTVYTIGHKTSSTLTSFVNN